MQHKAKKLFDLIKNLKTREEFEKKIKELQNYYDNLLDFESAALLIVDKLGENNHNILGISDLKPGIDCTIYGKITSISESRNFKRKNGSSGKVINLEIEDESGNCTLVLWNKDVSLITNKKIKIGTQIKVINGYTKNGYNGIEINVGKWSIIEIEPNEIPKIIIKNKKNDNYNKTIKGILYEKQSTKTFFRDNGEIGFVTNIKIKNKNRIQQLTLWDDKVKEIQKIKIGNNIEIKKFDSKQINGKYELHLNGKGIIKKI
jgi:replication factor A1